jgi:metallo-beta-lactamase family protein
MLLDWLQNQKQAKMVYVNHGDDEVCDIFAATIRDTLGLNAVAPYSGDEYDLLTCECTAKGRIVKLTKQSDGRRRANSIYEKLLSAGKRLLHIIEQSKGLTNKELAKFTDQINALCDKYSKK